MVVDVCNIARLLGFCCAVTIVTVMKFRWTGKNVDLALLTESIDVFLTSKGFMKRRNVVEKGNERMFMYSLEREGKPVIASVRICGLPDDFEVDFHIDQRAETMARLGILSTFLGSGFYMRGRLENAAYVKRLEGDFWDYVSEEIKRNSKHAKA
jgi:hypothetical protein